MGSIFLRCVQKRILLPEKVLKSQSLLFSTVQFTRRQNVFRSYTLIALRRRFNNFPQRFVNINVRLFAGGLALRRLRNELHCKNFTALCEGLDIPKQPVRRTIFKEKFILLKWISNLISLIRIILRAIRLYVTFSPLLFLYPFTILNSRLKSLWWQLLLLAVEFSGPAFVKLGQWASTRRDLFSKEFCDRFSKLHHDAKAHSWSHTKTTLEEAYGKTWKDFLLFGNNAKPIGSGCVAQVYKAFVREDKLNQVKLEEIQEQLEGIPIHNLEFFKNKTKWSPSSGDAAKLELVTEPGRTASVIQYDRLIPVAVKILHPGVRDTFARDLTLMSAMASCIQFVIPSLQWLSLTECVTEFAASMKKQMNMKHEAHCLDRLRRSFSRDPNIRIPVPLWPLVTRDVLVESFEEGELISNFLTEGNEHANSLRRKLAELGVNALLEMVFVNNFVHGDLHPGNILVQNAADFKEDAGTVLSGLTKPECPVKLVFLDCGITATLSESDRIKFREVFTAVIKGEGEAVADLFLKKTAHVECSDPVAFRRDMAAVVMQARQEKLSLSQIHVAELLSEVFRVLRTHRVKLESNFATVILAIAVLEGLGRSLDPHLDILEKARPVLIKQTIFS